MSDDPRAELHRLVDGLDEAQLSAALDRLAAEHGGEATSPAGTRAALEALYGQPIPAGDLERARVSLEHRRAS